MNTEAVFISNINTRGELLKATLTKISEGDHFRKYVVKKELHYYIAGSIDSILADDNVLQTEIGGYKKEYCGETGDAINCLLLRERGDRAGILVHYQKEGFLFAFFSVFTREMVKHRDAVKIHLAKLIDCSEETLLEKNGRFILLSDILAEVRDLFEG